MVVYIPIRGPEIDQLNPEYERFLADFSSLTCDEDLIALLDNEEKHKHLEKISFKIIYSDASNGNENEIVRSISNRHSFFKTELVVHFLRIELTFKYASYEKVDHAGIILSFVIFRLALIAHLTYATKIDFLQGVIFSSDDTYLDRTSILLSSLDYAYEHALKIGWPKMPALQLRETLSWFRNNDIHPDNNSKNKLHRAINSFSYQFSKLLENDTSILFWTMLGIEALLAEGSTNIIGQIKIKSSLILGEPIEYKKKLDKLYNYRSRFVHGDINFPAKFSSDYDNFEKEYYDYLTFATSILLSLIRHLISKDKFEFKFEYRLV